jgi:membrane protease YdiL (CAAX protease family)
LHVLNLADHIIFGLLAFVLPLFAVFKVRPAVNFMPTDTALKIKLYWANSMVLWVGALVIVGLWFFSGRSFAGLGFQAVSMEHFPEWMLITACFVLLYMFDAMTSWNEQESHPAAGILPVNWREFLHFGSVVSLSAGICEEIVFRGFIIFYLMALFEGGQYVVEGAIVCSALLFGVVHAYQGGLAFLKIVALAALFAWLYVLTQSLYLLIGLHFAIDFVGGLMSVLKQREEKRRKSPYHVG